MRTGGPCGAAARPHAYAGPERERRRTRPTRTRRSRRRRWGRPARARNRGGGPRGEHAPASRRGTARQGSRLATRQRRQVARHRRDVRGSRPGHARGHCSARGMSLDAVDEGGDSGDGQSPCSAPGDRSSRESPRLGTVRASRPAAKFGASTRRRCAGRRRRGCSRSKAAAAGELGLGEFLADWSGACNGAPIGVHGDLLGPGAHREGRERGRGRGRARVQGRGPAEAPAGRFGPSSRCPGGRWTNSGNIAATSGETVERSCSSTRG